MRIASVIIEGFVNSIYRSFIPMEALASRGHTVHVEERNDGIRPERFADFDVVCFWRYFHEPALHLGRHLSRAGVAMVWDNDDDLAAIPRGNPGYRRIGGLQGRRGMAAMVRMMQLADVVTTPSEQLAARYRRASGVEVRVIENYLHAAFVRQPPPRRPGIRVGWLAGLEHRTDYEQLRLREVFSALLERHPHVELMTIGLHLSLDHPRYIHVPTTDYNNLPALLSTFDIGIAPLADIPFNQSRSNIKVKEYGAVGVPWLASPIGPYADMDETHGGRLVPDHGWFDALLSLSRDPGLREQLAQRGRSWARTQTIARHVDEWESALEAAVEKSRAAGVR